MENICKAITYLTHLKRMMVTFKEEVGSHECISPKKGKTTRVWMYVDKGREEITCCRTSGNRPHVNGGTCMNM